MSTTLDYVVTTGDFIAEWMEDEGINAAELARRLGVTPKHVSELLSGKAPLSHPLALALERVTGIPSRLWNMYESGYRDALAREAAGVDLEAQYERAKEFPLSFLRKWGFITASARDRADTVRQLLGVLGVASLEAFDATWTRGSVAYRRAAARREDTPALAVWLALAERHHDGLRDVPAFDRSGLEALIPRLRALTRQEPVAAIEETATVLRAVGVVLCFIPAVPGLGIHGATRWVSGHPVVQLSILWKSDDQLWFTLFHELGHVLLHGEKELYLNGEQSAAEDEANAYASDVLIPPSFERRLPRNRDLAAVRQLADQLGIAPSIVLGRAQRKSKDYGWGHGLRRKLEFQMKRSRS
ncbi:XRE family transcriptional regulator [Asanoa ishikariensis]|uniref:HTH-type transcriptional regulator / antitoxin HigA n=1 Tax=Asanoa ishikariensis TaxID=137265 RepID=A0A1H3NTB5_9ACTN|nr:ImmA/IrrE family metallo-endopeptidase [Asanoa ishikariensis]GIF68423.1 XRE family transcriptional regulator [Asanoa ishikariensis]SDY91409.1 HTH-type transcriptional regulator / antitoxin HigA [Asanoa ishikariensis]